MLFELTEEQKEQLRLWNENHKKMCDFRNSTTIGGRLTFHFTPTALGKIIEVSCICGEKIDLTEDENW